MKITPQYNYQNTNFKSFKISYDAAEPLSRLPIGLLGRILKMGKSLEKTEHIDVELLPDLRFRIKEKGKVFSSYSEPFTVTKPKRNDNKIKLSARYDGVEDGNKKRGHICHTYLQYSTAEQALKGYEKIEFESSNNIDKIGAIAREYERTLVYKAAAETEPVAKTKATLLDILLNKYADIVKT